MLVERANRTLKERLEKYFYKQKTKRWVDILSQMTHNYNNTPHRSIGMAPSQVNDVNAADVFKKLFPDIHLNVKPRLSVGDQVRILKEKTIFEKGYKQKWSKEIYKIYKVRSTAGRSWYKVEDKGSSKLPGIKYYWQLNLVKKYATQSEADKRKDQRK